MNDMTPTSAERAEKLEGMGCKRKRVEDIRFGISGNLCRCTGYQNIVRAIQYAAAKLNGVPFREAA